MDAPGYASDAPDQDVVIRPAAVIAEAAARGVILWLNAHSIDKGGVWNVGESTGIWQRYDRAWNGPHGSRGDATLVGTVYVTYDRPRRYEVVVHRVQITEHGIALGWTTSKLVDEVLAQVGLSIATCPRDRTVPVSYAKDPFQRSDAYSRGVA